MSQINTKEGQSHIKGHPDHCPFCHNKITPINLYGYRTSRSLHVLLYCPNNSCNESFIAYYDNCGPYYQYNGKTSQGLLIGKSFNEIILSISTSFVEIFNQAYSAEQQNLTEICGVGYRKALEFLIKDYLILNNPDDREQIEKKLLGPCISEYVNDDRIKTVSKRAVWLGNDETHYVRKWEGKNLADLKILIDLTVHWIEMETLTKNFITEMPD